MTKQIKVDVAILGAGTAGLSALKEVRRHTQNFLVIDKGPLGTTCSRTGCMPSKALLQIAHEYRALERLKARGAWQGSGGLDRPRILAEVRRLRDYFTSFAVKDTEDLGDRFLRGHARFSGPHSLIVDDNVQVEARVIILAVGSRPKVPKEWRAFGDRIVTTEQFFELPDLPDTWGVVGLGPIGLEIGQALAHLGMDVTGYNEKERIGGLKDLEVNAAAVKALGADFTLNLGSPVTLAEAGGKITMTSGRNIKSVDRVLVAMGREPNLEGLDLPLSGCERDHRGLPRFDGSTMAVSGAPLFIAGDFDGERPVLHEASDEGHIAGYNALKEKPESFHRRVPLGITFTAPTLGFVGEAPREGQNYVTGKVSFEAQGRAVIMGENRGLLSLHANAEDGRLLSAEFAAPGGEHLAHLLAFAVQQRLSVEDLLQLPFYHPTVTEGLRTALRAAAKELRKTSGRTPGPELALQSK